MEELESLSTEPEPAEVTLEHYERFLDLDDEQMERLIEALTRAQGKSIVRFFAPSKRVPVQKRISDVAEEDLFAVALGIGRFDTFCQFRHHRREGTSPDHWTEFRIEKKIKSFLPSIQRAANAFVKETLFGNSQSSKQNQST